MPIWRPRPGDRFAVQFLTHGVWLGYVVTRVTRWRVYFRALDDHPQWKDRRMSLAEWRKRRATSHLCRVDADWKADDAAPR